MAQSAKSTIERNLHAVHQRMADAAVRSGRSASAVSLLAVTKSVPVDAIRALHELGVRDMGESRPQALWERVGQLPADIRWHLIGHLQTNKIRRTLPLVCSIDSLDRWSLAEALSSDALRLGRRVPVLLEVNLTGETAKHGFSADELRARYSELIEQPGLDIRGLMTMARLEEDAERCRSTFGELRQLRDELRAAIPSGPELDVLSMGMSNDFEVAIEEGATQVRVGSALFEGLHA